MVAVVEMPSGRMLLGTEPWNCRFLKGYRPANFAWLSSMARLFPALDPSDIHSPGERLVARALVEQLPNKVEC